MANELIGLLEGIHDETSFIKFLRVLIEDLERSERECSRAPHECAEAEHWESVGTKDYLESIEDWASRGDFADGVHHGEPLLRRFATMLFVGKYRKR